MIKKKKICKLSVVFYVRILVLGFFMSVLNDNEDKFNKVVVEILGSFCVYFIYIK